MKKIKYNEMQRRLYDVKNLKFRAVEGENNEMILEGYAALYDVRSKLLYNSFYEVIEKGAFDNVLKNEDLDVVLNFNHDNSTVVARTTNGTLELSSDDNGLFFRATLNDTSDAVNLYKRVKRGDIYQNSFAFLPKEWKEDTDDEGNTIVRVSEIETLRDVSAVTFPAYEETSLSARNDGVETRPIVEETLRNVTVTLESGTLTGSMGEDEEGLTSFIIKESSLSGMYKEDDSEEEYKINFMIVDGELMGKVEKVEDEEKPEGEEDEEKPEGEEDEEMSDPQNKRFYITI